MTHDRGHSDELQVATFAGGCFWCLEAVFSQLRGVESVVPGYSGGSLPNPTYRQVCSGQTGHAEAVQLRFKPALISYRALLEVFFAIHDPTTLNRQGADIGTQYRSAVFYHDEEQRETAVQVIAALTDSKTWDNPVVTELAEFRSFYPAEDYHHDYFVRNRGQPYCQFVVAPKVAAFRKHFGSLLKS